MDQETLRAAVNATFAQDPASTATWSNPHANRAPDPEEYSRCMDPGKYRILTARAAAWAHVLTETGLATSESIDLTEGANTWREGFPSSIAPVLATRLRPHQPGAIPLVLSVRGFEDLDDNLITISAGQPAVPLTTVPACGCDACDDGSQDLLAELDDHVLDVITGDLVHVSTPRLTAISRSRGWKADAADDNSDGLGKVDQLLQDARGGRSPHQVVHGVRWW